MKLILAEVVTIGDEILYGQITDTNTQWMSTELDKIGIKTVRKSSVGDQEDKILQILAEAESRADIILLTGGLGPTKDDITKKTLCKYFNDELIINEDALGFITDFFAKRGRPLTEINRLQAAVPSRCTYLANKTGTAPGMWFEHNGKIFVSMPGVPHEMKYLMTNEVIPRLKTFFETPIIYHKLIRTIGVGESFLAEKIENWEDNLPEHIKLAYLPSFGQVKLRLTAVGSDENQLKKDVDDEIEKVLPLIQPFVFGFDTDDLEVAVGKELKKRGLTVSAAESCSGGYASHMFTKVPGSSAYFMGSVVSYDNSVKIKVLGVKPETIEEHGAVSEETVIQMAEGVRKLMKTDFAIATSGIAGPDGGTPEKPVGTLWIACAMEGRTIARKVQMATQRDVNIQYASVVAINLLRKMMNGDYES
ncbi:competence/damage-inducible protein CinA [Emticicia oligotrophica DSM 17448]|uniref:CinA-like protein n=1 Tax=Emticicia oligotrophica (strain DSM 17448 / CIP 109782 / MTCC 6937 / GPTSA100-15) TaxID=929562 RepID=A0ABN4ATN1_EMTOG|nr:competence/damage-inducible protein A [Emticicia oligotrophica]AFK05208.1 competence/damage-inducible protein CinA [Emticicia oligotrophica DSM 17448]